MAVTPVFEPNLSGAYANIQNALSQRADIAANTPGPAAALSAAITPIGNIVKERQQKLFDATLEDHLNQNKAAYAAQAAGKSLVTPDEFGDLADTMGLDRDKAMALVPDSVYMSPEDKQGLVSTLKRGQTIEQMASQEPNPKKANLIRLLGRSNDPQADQWLARLSGISKLVLKINPADKLMHIWDEMSGQDLGLAPGGNSSPGETPAISVFNDINQLKHVDKSQADALMAGAKSAANDPALKTTAKDLDGLMSLRDAIVKNNPTSSINIRADLARDIGGVPGGKFSSLLASAEGTDPSTGARTAQWIETHITGKLTKTNQDELLAQLDSVVTAKKSQLAAALQEKHTQLKSDAPYASDDLIANQLGYQRYLTPAAPTPSSPGVGQASAVSGKALSLDDFKSAADVKTALNAGQINRDQAIKILKAKFGKT